MANNPIDFDPNCDPANPRVITLEAIQEAAKRISDGVIRTPLVKAHMSDKLGMDLYMKLESFQHTGSFKERGCRNTLLQLPDEQKKQGVTTSSFGNHGLGLAYHSKLLNVPCVIVTPTSAAQIKINKIKGFGATCIQHGKMFSESRLHSLQLAKDKNMVYVNGYDHPHIVEGQGTIGLEILEDLPDADAVLVPVGGGSICTGTAVAIKGLKPGCQVYGIESDKVCSMAESLKKNERIFLPIEPNICEGLAVNTVGVNTFHNIKGVIDKMIVVKEDWVFRAMTHLIEDEKIIGEGAGSVGLAAIMAGMLPNLKGKKVVIIISGANVDSMILGRCLQRGLGSEGRLVKFKIAIPDKPGALADLCALISSLGITLREVTPEGLWGKGDVFQVQLKVVAETTGWEHSRKMMELIKQKYKDYYFPDLNPADDKGGARRGPCLAPNPVCMQK